MEDKPTPDDPHREVCDKLDRVLQSYGDLVSVLTSHGRLIEKHSKTLDDISRVLRSVDAGVASIRDAQRAQNQLTANLHLMYSQLACIKGNGDDDPDCPDEFKKRTPSEELRQLRALDGGGDE